MTIDIYTSIATCENMADVHCRMEQWEEYQKSIEALCEQGLLEPQDAYLIVLELNQGIKTKIREIASLLLN
jgi:hypothetical protein